MSDRILDDEFLTLAEVARITRREAGTLYNWRSRGEGPPSIKVRGLVMYRRSELERWLKAEEAASLRSNVQSGDTIRDRRRNPTATQPLAT